MAKKKIKLEEVKPADVKGLLRDVPLENPVELTSVTRFSADHILRTSYNPTSKAVVLEDVPAGLKSEFTLGESSGGIMNPFCEVKIVNTTADTGIDIWYPTYVDGNMTYRLGTCDEGETKTFTFPAFYYTDPEEVIPDAYLVYIESWTDGTTFTSSSEEVNCVYNSADGTITVTDASLASSITLTLGE